MHLNCCSPPFLCVYSQRCWLSKLVGSEEAGDITAAGPDLSGMSFLEHMWEMQSKPSVACRAWHEIALVGPFQPEVFCDFAVGQVCLTATTEHYLYTLGRSPPESHYFVMKLGEYWSLEENNLASFEGSVWTGGGSSGSGHFFLSVGKRRKLKNFILNHLWY